MVAKQLSCSLNNILPKPWFFDIELIQISPLVLALLHFKRMRDFLQDRSRIVSYRMLTSLCCCSQSTFASWTAMAPVWTDMWPPSFTAEPSTDWPPLLCLTLCMSQTICLLCSFVAARLLFTVAPVSEVGAVLVPRTLARANALCCALTRGSVYVASRPSPSRDMSSSSVRSRKINRRSWCSQLNRVAEDVRSSCTSNHCTNLFQRLTVLNKSICGVRSLGKFEVHACLLLLEGLTVWRNSDTCRLHCSCNLIPKVQRNSLQYWSCV